jgi:hypothetical protein
MREVSLLGSEWLHELRPPVCYVLGLTGVSLGRGTALFLLSCR